MRELYADTGFWLAISLRRDQHNPLARKFLSSFDAKTRIVTSELVLIEYLNHFSRSDSETRKEIITRWRKLRSDDSITIVPAGDALIDKAATLFERSSDKAWSMTDCASFVIMQDRGIVDALTNDHHFEQAGFQALLRLDDGE